MNKCMYMYIQKIESTCSKKSSTCSELDRIYCGAICASSHNHQSAVGENSGKDRRPATTDMTYDLPSVGVRAVDVNFRDRFSVAQTLAADG